MSKTEPARINPGLPILTKLLEFDWSKIISLFDQCGDDDGPSNEQIRNPGARAVVRMARDYRAANNMPRRQWRKNRNAITRSIREECASLDDADCELMRQEWREERADNDSTDEVLDANGPRFGSEIIQAE